LIFRSSELSVHLGGELIGPDVGVEGASIDSRTIRPGQLSQVREEIRKRTLAVSKAGWEAEK